MHRTVVYFIDSTALGGTELMLLTLMGGLNRQDWQPILAYIADPGVAALGERARKLDIPVWVLPPRKAQQARKWVFKLAADLRALRPSVFHAHLNWPLACTQGLFAAVLARVPAIVATQQLFGQIGSRRFELLHKLLSIGVHRYIAVSKDVAGQLRQNCFRPNGKIQVIPNAVQPGIFNRSADASLRASLSDGTGLPIVLTLARLERQKGLPYLLEAAAQVPQARFFVAGEGNERGVLEEQARSLGVTDRFFFLGHRHDIPELLAACDLFVLPSVNEGLPVSVLEAMASCKPVIASAIGGTDEAVVHGKTGLLVPPRDSGALASAIRTLLESPTLREQFAFAGRARVQEEFSAETMVQRTMGLYDKLLA
jgi:glycosyltransferase involved in cell wall biosynthesis